MTEGMEAVGLLVAANTLLIVPIYVFLNMLNGSIKTLSKDIQEHDREIHFIKGTLSHKEDS